MYELSLVGFPISYFFYKWKCSYKVIWKKTLVLKYTKFKFCVKYMQYICWIYDRNEWLLELKDKKMH